VLSMSLSVVMMCIGVLFLSTKAFSSTNQTAVPRLPGGGKVCWINYRLLRPGVLAKRWVASAKVRSCTAVCLCQCLGLWLSYTCIARCVCVACVNRSAITTVDTALRQTDTHISLWFLQTTVSIEPTVCFVAFQTDRHLALAAVTLTVK